MSISGESWPLAGFSSTLKDDSSFSDFALGVDAGDECDVLTLDAVDMGVLDLDRSSSLIALTLVEPNSSGTSLLTDISCFT